eukprot:GHRQ01018201.1.p1 GENE.GHRQ01018201.1~~GHRQ01018201.1.p1  ORF type:complete len:485 (+),score=174.84 GHRQ01018201.1:201-1655(+)
MALLRAPALRSPAATSRRNRQVCFRLNALIYTASRSLVTPAPCGPCFTAAGVASAACRRSLQQPRTVMARAAAPDVHVAPDDASTAEKCLICTSITAPSMDAFLQEIAEASATGVDVLELRLDFIQDFEPMKDLERLMSACSMPYIVTYRPAWEGGNYEGPEPERLATLKLAALKGAPYVDVEYKASALFFAGAGEVPVSSRVILSSHNFKETPPAAELHARAAAMREAGADIVKIATMANDISDAAVVLSLLQQKTGPTIALAMGERGQITRLLAAKYGGHLTFAALSDARASAPGQPTIAQLQQLYGFAQQGPSTKLYGIMGNPVHHSKSPLIHNTAFRHLGHDGVFVPLLVDDLPRFMDAFQEHDFQGFSVTIPHKEAAHKAAASRDPVADQIGACNTLIRQPDGSGFKGFNTDWIAAISAIERVLAAGSSEAAAATSSSSSSNEEGQPSPLQVGCEVSRGVICGVEASLLCQQLRHAGGC